ncbi:MAG: hypothetical protein CMJ78_04165 [Planctomycetaceae bacterium]|nr:hypothetical protein [Planctomycetaceae bacterium]
MSRTSFSAVALLACLVLSGCCSFEREWRNCQSYAQDSDGLAGCWEGTWLSDYNGHNGRLRAVITKQDEHTYHANFKATYWGFIPFQFDLPMHVQEHEDGTSFEGTIDLGLLAGGDFSYSGQADATQFSANYQAAKDYGTFIMTRPGTCVDCNEE